MSLGGLFGFLKDQDAFPQPLIVVLELFDLLIQLVARCCPAPVHFNQVQFSHHLAQVGLIRRNLIVAKTVNMEEANLYTVCYLST